jgi:hypothetical protein
MMSTSGAMLSGIGRLIDADHPRGTNRIPDFSDPIKLNGKARGWARHPGDYLKNRQDPHGMRQLRGPAGRCWGTRPVPDGVMLGGRGFFVSCSRRALPPTVIPRGG